MNGSHGVSSQSRRHKHEGPRNHIISYIISILLTMLAFAAVLYGGFDKTFLYLFLLLLGVVQVIFQLAYWMHMKEKGHMLPIISLIFGVVVMLTAVAAGVLWTWI